jgi:alpha-N-arabinofuranosidase
VDAVATHDADAAATSVFLVNRSQSEATTVTIDIRALGAVEVVSAQTLSDDDVYAKNTLAQQERVGLSQNDSAVAGDGTITVTLPPVSWTALELHAA